MSDVYGKALAEFQYLYAHALDRLLVIDVVQYIGNPAAQFARLVDAEAALQVLFSLGRILSGRLVAREVAQSMEEPEAGSFGRG